MAAGVGAAMAFALVPAQGAAASGADPGRPPVTEDGLRDLEALLPVMECADVVGLTLDVRGAPVTFTSATVVTSSPQAPYCEARGTIAPADTIVLRLPLEGWTQRYVQTGCGGLCGTAEINYT